ncbi:PP2C family protein-serine/threonine phosphatase [Streptomyces sp. NPDC005181]|uniref:PP2C family protein-serine/threonine phosphatase n=1 Tax=Streptomyces sp. NPDC005181 TaxID=3156869 RepID=UPI0033B950F0
MTGVRLLARLLDASDAMALEQLPDIVREHAASAGLYNVLIYLSDLQECVLRPLTGRESDAGYGEDSGTGQLSVEGTQAGRTFQGISASFEPGPRTRWWVPLLDGAERIGVMRVDTDGPGEPLQPLMHQLATLVTMMIVTKRAHSDSYARRVRTQPMNVAAEMQWNLMPPRAFANEYVTISAAMEPAYEVGGDAFDYALAGGTVHLSIFDAMGHDVAAGLAANLAVGATRNSRRHGADLIETGRTVERILAQHLAESRYVTALLVDLDLCTGQLSWISHGHHPPVVIRGGRRTGPRPCPPGAPLGMGLDLHATLCRDQLVPGDRLMLYTDGITETHSPGGEEFGLDRFINFIIRHNADGMPVPETLRRLVRGILDHHGGRLQDDATVLFLEWHGPQSPEARHPNARELLTSPPRDSRHADTSPPD